MEYEFYEKNLKPDARELCQEAAGAGPGPTINDILKYLSVRHNIKDHKEKDDLWTFLFTDNLGRDN